MSTTDPESIEYLLEAFKDELKTIRLKYNDSCIEDATRAYLLERTIFFLSELRKYYE